MPLGNEVRKRKVRSALAAVGSSQADCARSLALSEATVSRVISGLQNSERVEQWIAERTGVAREELFADETAATAA